MSNLNISKEYTSAIGRLETSAIKQRQAIGQQAEESKQAIHLQRGKLEQSLQRALGEVRKVGRQELRKRDLPLTKATRLQVAEVARRTQETARGIESELQGLLRQVKVAEATNLASLEAQVAVIRARLAEQREVEAKWLELPDGEWVSREYFSELETKYQDKLKELGVDKYNKYIEQELRFKYVELSTGEYVSKADFEKLPSEERTRLKKLGVDRYNTWFLENHQKLSTGEWIPRADYDELTPVQQGWLRILGVDKFNTRIEQQQADFEAENIQIGAVANNEWITRESFTSLPTQKMRDIVLTQGLSAISTKGLAPQQELNKHKEWGLVPPDTKLALGSYDDEGNYIEGSKEKGEWSYQFTHVGGHAYSRQQELKADSTFFAETKREFFASGQIRRYDAFKMAGLEHKLVKYKPTGYKHDIEATWAKLSQGERIKVLAYFYPKEPIGPRFLFAAKLFIPAVWLVDRKKMTTTEIAINVALDVLFVGTFLFGGAALRQLAKLKALTPSARNTARLASEAYTANLQMSKAFKVAKATTPSLAQMSSKTYAAKLAQPLQDALATSMKADQAFVHSLASLKGVPAKRIAALQRTLVDLRGAAALGDPKLLPLKTLATSSTAKQLSQWKNTLQGGYPTRGWGKPVRPESMKPAYYKIVEKKPKAPPAVGTVGAVEKYLATERSLQPRVSVATATKTKPALTEIKLEPVFKPKARPKATPSVFPGISPKTKIAIVLPTKTKTITARELATMTPEQAQRLFGSEVLVIAIGRPLPQIIAKEIAQDITSPIDRAAVVAAVEVVIMAAVKAVTRGATEAKVKTVAQTALRAQIKSATSAKVKVALQTKTATIIKMAVARAKLYKVVMRIFPKVPIRVQAPKGKPVIILPLTPGASYARLTPHQKAGAVAWKQGFMYKLIYPPYGQNDIINSRKAILGVKIVSGARSAYKSIANVYPGELPPQIARDMGVFDVFISTKERGKPKLRFRRDPKQRTKVTLGVSGIGRVR